VQIFCKVFGTLWGVRGLHLGSGSTNEALFYSSRLLMVRSSGLWPSPILMYRQPYTHGLCFQGRQLTAGTVCQEPNPPADHSTYTRHLPTIPTYTRLDSTKSTTRLSGAKSACRPFHLHSTAPCGWNSHERVPWSCQQGSSFNQKAYNGHCCGPPDSGPEGISS
jgi:hypothetical protein